MIVIEDHTLLRTSFVALLKLEFSDWDFIESPTVEDIDATTESDVRLVVFDIGDRSLDDPRFVASVEALRKSFPRAEISVISDGVDADLAIRALKLGVSGVLSKAQSIVAALHAIHIVLAGGLYCPRNLGGACEMYENGHQPQRQRHDETAALVQPTFTPREEAVLGQLRLGQSNKIIAARLNLSENTVKMHIQHIMRKLRVQNRTEIVVRLGAESRRPGFRGRPLANADFA